MEGERVSVGFDMDGHRTVVHDRWRDPLGNLYNPKKSWKGWTFLKLPVPLKPSLGGRFVEPLLLLADRFGEKEKMGHREGLVDNYGATMGAVDMLWALWLTVVELCAVWPLNLVLKIRWKFFTALQGLKWGECVWDIPRF